MPAHLILFLHLKFAIMLCLGLGIGLPFACASHPVLASEVCDNALPRPRHWPFFSSPHAPPHLLHRVRPSDRPAVHPRARHPTLPPDRAPSHTPHPAQSKESSSSCCAYRSSNRLRRIRPRPHCARPPIACASY